MRAMKTPRSNHNFGPPASVTDGSITDLPCERRVEAGSEVVRSVWVPTREERAAIANGENVELDVFWIGAFPPVAVNVTDEQPTLQVAAGSANGVGLIAWERLRQETVEGWSPDHDDIHDGGSLAKASACYAMPELAPRFWPWDIDGFKPGDRLRELVKAGALIAAEIDRLQRAERSAS